ncbi:uncharacterized protein TNCV_5087381 [Trichonephila clavipes]|nr:uncharacterized protein TNCV_5087381 [Trichonephila clavipes]
MQQKAYFTPRSERSLKKICLENRFSTTKVIKSQLQDINVNGSEFTVRRKLKDLNFKTCRPTRKPMFNPCNENKASELAKQWRDKDVDFWRSVCCLDMVKGMMRQDQYKDVLQNRLIPQLEERFPNGESYILVQDGAPCYKARSIKDFLVEQNILLLNWPDNSPDMNPIENVWELMKGEVAIKM